MTAGTFDDWADHFASYDVQSLLAEAATLKEREPFNHLAAMFSRLLDLIGSDGDMSDQLRVAALRLAMVLERGLDDMTSGDIAVQGRWHVARDAQLARLIKFAAYPEYVRLLVRPPSA